MFHLANTSYGDIRERVSQRVGTRQTFPVHEDSIDVQDSQTLMAQHREPSVDPETFWGVPTTYPAPPIVPHTSALDDHDQQALMKVLRWVSYGAIGQLNAHSDLEDVYHHLMTTPPEMHHPEKTTMTTPDSQETHD